MDGWVFAIGDQRTDVFGKGEVKRHGNNGGSEGVAANHQHSGGDATDERKWIHGSKEIRLNAGAADDAPVVRFTAQLPYLSFTTAVQRRCYQKPLPSLIKPLETTVFFAHLRQN